MVSASTAADVRRSAEALRAEVLRFFAEMRAAWTDRLRRAARDPPLSGNQGIKRATGPFGPAGRRCHRTGIAPATVTSAPEV
jgi:hypothetical protein